MKISEFCPESKDSPKPLIPEGEYEAVCIKHEQSDYLKNEKRLYVWFRIIEGKYEGVELFCSYNFIYRSFSSHTKYYTDWSIANGAPPRRKDRMSPIVFKNCVFTVKVTTARPSYGDGSFKPDMFQYSIIKRVVEKLTGKTCSN